MMLDCEVIANFRACDERGEFHKVFNIDSLKLKSFNLEECFFSKNHKNVIRGMHFQTGEYEHNKFVFALTGSILDVVLCIDPYNVNYGKFDSIFLNAKNNVSLFIPKGYAHGFLSLEEDTIVGYLTDRKYSPEHDQGYHFDSFGFNWPCNDPIVSTRDHAHQRFF